MLPTYECESLLHEIFLFLGKSEKIFFSSFVDVDVGIDAGIDADAGADVAADVVINPLVAGRFLRFRVEAASFRIKRLDAVDTESLVSLARLCRLDDDDNDDAEVVML